MARPIVTYKFDLPGGRTFVLKELNLAELRLVLQASNKDAFDGSMKGLQLSLVEVDGERLTPDHLAGANLGNYFSVREFALVQSAFSSIHDVDEEALEAVKKSQTLQVGGIQ